MKMMVVLLSIEEKNFQPYFNNAKDDDNYDFWIGIHIHIPEQQAQQQA